ncbi:hypothetical protein NE619_04915 [Anaerovorax odorimutans]|uniref:Uncharacterized protein n=1 Tax=Anaerovorax odorimutans TaxID=109327 RepID=A0ABT1RLK3_9FIRM|nr:hypothetical protein [Anaerovorax odorimutans]MCQ4636059.1 hypothetical protein [Anaerovorax odorimutans]
MKKRSGAILCVCAIVFAAIMISGCSVKMEEPVFVKNLICTEDMDVDIMYISGMTGEKKVKSVEIPDAPKGIETVVYDEESETISGYSLHTIHMGVSSDNLNEDSGLAEPLAFSRLNITWDDGTETVADVGTIEIRSVKQQGLQLIGEEKNDQQGKSLQWTSSDFQAEKKLNITGVNIPYQEKLEPIISNITINQVPIAEIDSKHPIKLEKGDTCTVSYSCDEGYKFPYGRVAIDAQLIGVDEQGNKQAALVHMQPDPWIEEDISGYLKTVKEQ